MKSIVLIFEKYSEQYLIINLRKNVMLVFYGLRNNRN